MKVDYKKIEEEYLPGPEDDDLIREFKESIFNELTEPERKILIYYCEVGTYAGVAKLLHNSPPTAKKVITEILNKIK